MNFIPPKLVNRTICGSYLRESETSLVRSPLPWLTNVPGCISKDSRLQKRTSIELFKSVGLINNEELNRVRLIVANIVGKCQQYQISIYMATVSICV